MSLSYLLLLSNPLTPLFQSILQIMAAATCLGRVEEFLETMPQIIERKVKKARDIVSKEMAIHGDAAIVIRNGQSFNTYTTCQVEIQLLNIPFAKKSSVTLGDFS